MFVGQEVFFEEEISTFQKDKEILQKEGIIISCYYNVKGSISSLYIMSLSREDLGKVYSVSFPGITFKHPENIKSRVSELKNEPLNSAILSYNESIAYK